MFDQDYNLSSGFHGGQTISVMDTQSKIYRNEAKIIALEIKNQELEEKLNKLINILNLQQNF